MNASSSPSDSLRAVSGDTSAASPAPLLDPRNDYVFKRIFAQRVDLLSDLVNVIRGDAEPLTLTEVLNPTILPEEVTGKGIVLDVKALDAQGRTIDVEVQVNSQRDYPARVLHLISERAINKMILNYGRRIIMRVEVDQFCETGSWER